MELTKLKAWMQPAALIATITGRVLVSFMFLTGVFNHVHHWQTTVGEMRQAGVTYVPDFLLGIAMVVSGLAASSLLIGFRSGWAALILGLYSIVVSWELHNPYGGFAAAMLFVKDLTIAGALFMYFAEKLEMLKQSGTA